LVLERRDLVVDLLEGARGRQDVLAVVGDVEDLELGVGRRNGRERAAGGDGRGQNGGDEDAGIHEVGSFC